MGLKWCHKSIDVDAVTDDYLDAPNTSVVFVIEPIVNMPVTRLSILNRGNKDIIARWIGADELAASIDVADDALDDDDDARSDTFIIPAGLPFSVDLTNPSAWESRGLAFRYVADPTTGTFIEINYSRATKTETGGT